MRLTRFSFNYHSIDCRCLCLKTNSNTHALMMTVRAFLRSLSRNQSIKYPDILGASE